MQDANVKKKPDTAADQQRKKELLACLQRNDNEKPVGSLSLPPQADTHEEEETVAPLILEEGIDGLPYFHGYVLIITGLVNNIMYSCVFRLLPRDDIEAMLKRNGHFVLRVTELTDATTKVTSREMCLSVFWSGTVYHFLLRPNAAKRYQICPGDKIPEFDSVMSLVKHYMKTEAEFGEKKIVLKKSVHREVSFFNQCLQMFR